MRFTPNDSMESTETGVGEGAEVRWAVSPPTTRWRVLKLSTLCLGCGSHPSFTPNDSMESTETIISSSPFVRIVQFHPQRLDGEY